MSVKPRTIRSATICGTILVAVAIGGCGGNSGTPASPTTSFSQDPQISGSSMPIQSSERDSISTWVATGFMDNGKRVAVGDITLKLGDHSLEGNAGCGPFSGTYTVQDSRLHVSDLKVGGGCDQGGSRSEVNAAVLELLRGAPVLGTNGLNMKLSGSGKVLQLRKA